MEAAIEKRKERPTTLRRIRIPESSTEAKQPVKESDIELQHETIRNLLTQEVITLGPRLMIATRESWLLLDSFIESHKGLKDSNAGLRNAPTPRIRIDNFIFKCSEMSAQFREIFLEDAGRTSFSLQLREYARVLHEQFESCVIDLSALSSRSGLDPSEIHGVVSGAHELKSIVGQIMLKMGSLMCVD